MNHIVFVLIILLVVGAGIYLLDRLPIDATIKLFIKVFAIVASVIYVITQLVKYIN